MIEVLQAKISEVEKQLEENFKSEPVSMKTICLHADFSILHTILYHYENLEKSQFIDSKAFKMIEERFGLDPFDLKLVSDSLHTKEERKSEPKNFVNLFFFFDEDEYDFPVEYCVGLNLLRMNTSFSFKRPNSIISNYLKSINKFGDSWIIYNEEIISKINNFVVEKARNGFSEGEDKIL
ncbi:TPA: hypothetical protein SMW33_004518 [Pseudomonas aeruginosa]|nr:hypothetical protein [Pseudomonas aeruginosa]HEK3577570.1 hypothetical protein [Pseudomonas aeruginosa]HEK3590459.1 hypothetical protein [Pseudomonas aeruginosa]